jgi:hypothetical protein
VFFRWLEADFCLCGLGYQLWKSHKIEVQTRSQAEDERVRLTGPVG